MSPARPQAVTITRDSARAMAPAARPMIRTVGHRRSSSPVIGGSPRAHQGRSRRGAWRECYRQSDRCGLSAGMVHIGGAPRSPRRGARARIASRKRTGRDSNPRYGFTPYVGLANRCLQPLGHLSPTDSTSIIGGPEEGVKPGGPRPPKPLGAGPADPPSDRPVQAASTRGTAVPSHNVVCAPNRQTRSCAAACKFPPGWSARRRIL